MSAAFGGVGQFDYAAANGALDAFARHEGAGHGGAEHGGAEHEGTEHEGTEHEGAEHGGAGHGRAGTDGFGGTGGSGGSGGTVRLGIGWDAWRDAGMARAALGGDARHRAHLEVGLSTAEALEVLGAAVELQLPHLLVSTTPLEASRYFYEPARTTAAGPHTAAHEAAGELTAALCRLLGVDSADSLDPDASLYDLGADSLTLLDLLSEIKRLCGVDLDLAELGHEVSLNQLLSRARPDRSTADGSAAGGPVAVEVWQPGHEREVLCLVHPVGGDIQAYRPLVSALASLGAGPTVCLIPDPALRESGTSPPAWSVAERATRYHAALRARFPGPDVRFRFAGWSFGAWVALSMAAEAEAAGRPADHLYLLDPPAPDAGARLGGYDEAAIRTVFDRELRGNGEHAPLTGTGHAYAERLAHCCRANLAAMAAHRPPRLSHTPSTLWLATSALADPPDAHAWDALLPHPSSVHRVDATHYGLVAAPHAESVARAMRRPRTPGE
ncbi:hypothetical protein G5C65_14560 [Streptomyces sp. SB3404]|uniref:Carrier domain-containing protein n=2 Tax=Streptomyces boncukensis TaxID=2711219 RepID=A0A6G4WYF8_9ACTN|nr:hypothetical protein [Streptomyces boncukensis]